ncbi:MAG TPA: hypothetical protein VGJ48_22420, partial [Pyrinomonadaceae bacterium]
MIPKPICAVVGDGMRVQQTAARRFDLGPGLCLGEMGWVALAQMGVPLASILSVKLLTQLLVPSEYGVVAVVVSYVLAALSISIVPMSGPGIILFHKWHGMGRTREFLGTLLAFYAISAGLIGLALIAVTSVRQLSASQLVKATLLYGTLLLFAEVIKAPMISLTNAARLRRRYAILSMLDGWGRLALALLIIILAGSTFRSVLIAYALNSAVVVFLGWYALFSSSSHPISNAPVPFFSPGL